MNRRDSMKSMLLGSLAGGLVLNGCAPKEDEAAIANVPESPGYGRTPEEKERDQMLRDQEFFQAHELETIAVLCDLILPATSEAGSATDAGVPEFIEFIVKDMPTNKTPIRGGLMWLNSRANNKFGKPFKDISEAQQKQMLDEIAYPDKAAPDVAPGVKFFTMMRNLTLTGYYTTKMGIDDLGYVGNRPNIWDGVPEDVLAAHGMAYEEEWLAKCVDQETREVIAEWDDEGNLIT